MPTPRPRFLILPVALFLPLLAFQAAEPPQPTPFTAVVAEHFDVWDRDHDGVLEPAEIDWLTVQAELSGKPAAAIGALKAAARSVKVTLPPLTQEYFRAYEQTVADRKPRSPDFDRAYSRNLRRITSTKRELFLDDQPGIETAHQGPLGDCFFVSVIGASVVRDPAAVRGMITVTEDGMYDVAFPDGRHARIAPLTDAELALTSTTTNRGIWLSVLEKAYGSLRNESLAQDKRTESATDAIARGGSAATSIRLMTGHAVTQIGLKPRRPRTSATAKRPGESGEQTTPAPGAQPGIDPEVLARHIETVLPKVREQLAVAMENRRLVAAGTPTPSTPPLPGEALPPGINPKHSYAVLAYDAGADTIELWNPHGNTFRPKGEPGLESGYPTRAGRFTMPVTEFVRVFQGISFETDKPDTRGQPPAR